MVEQSNGQSMRPKRRRHNAKRCRFATRQAIICGLANDESVEFIRRKYHISRHTVLAIREQYAHEIEATRERIAAVIELRCYELAHQAMDTIGRQIEVERSPLRLLKICSKLTDKAAMLCTPVQTDTPEPFELKFGKFRHGKLVEF